MIPHLQSLRMKSSYLLILFLLILQIGNTSCAVGHVQLTVGGKLDIEAQLLTKMYVLLLRHAGFDVTEKARLGGNEAVFEAITNGAIDLYPEFTTTGLAQLGLTTTHNVQQDYQLVKQGYEKNYRITWLAVAPLNDTYGICTSKVLASQLHVTEISQLAGLTPRLTIATPADGQDDPGALSSLKSTYGISFNTELIPAAEKTFQAVIDGKAQLNVCYTTSPLISQYNFVLLNDDKNSFPIYNPAPIVRDEVLAQAPEIANVLNPLALKLTNNVSIMLQDEVNSGLSVEDVASAWLESQSLL